MKWAEFVADYLSFTKKDRIGILLLLLVIAGVFLIPQTIPSNAPKAGVIEDTAWAASMKRLEQKTIDNDQQAFSENNSSNYQYDRSQGYTQSLAKGELFNFDPNTLSAEGWKKLGLREKTIHTIQNYLSKGGHFRKPEDLQRVYGLFPDEFERLAPFIKIEAAEKENSFTGFAEKTPGKEAPVKNYAPRYFIADINSADTTALIALPGIGSKLAMRIINFRDKLGGFYSISQVGETFGLADSTFQKIKQYLKLESSSVKKININTATLDELKAHPYIKWSIANPIIAYRNEHGNFLNLEDLKKVMAVTDAIYQKMAPYLEVR